MTQSGKMDGVRRTLATIIVAFTMLLSALPVAAQEPSPIQPYIVGGSRATATTWPSMVALVHETPSGLAQMCGGTLIRPDIVLTAAHCTEAFVGNPSDLMILLGRTNLLDTGGELVDASAIIQHPNWNPSVFAADISIVRLSTRSTRQTTRITTNASEPNWHTHPYGVIAGWGGTDPNSDEADSELQELEVAILPDNICVGTATYQVGVDLCGGDGFVGPCFGDSGGPFVTHFGGTVRLAGVISRGPETCAESPGIYTRVAAYADWIFQSTQSPNTTRTSGPDRYITAAKLSASFAPGVPITYLVTGEQFPDAVTAAAAAGGAGGPVLLTRRDGLPDATRNELTRLAPQRLVVVGGQSAITDSVAQAASQAAGVTAVRLSGSNRYETAAAISSDARPSGSGTVFVTVGSAFPDAVASGPVAGGPDGGPVLLTERATLTPATRDELIRLAPTRVVILGGGSAVAPAVESAISSSVPAATIQRVSGADRYATAAALSTASFDPGVPVVYLATGRSFPDALATGPVAVANGAPVLLIDGPNIPPSVSAEIRRLGPQRLVVLGGGAAIPAEAAWLLDGLLAT